MSSEFLNALEREIKMGETVKTENGAIGYVTTGKCLLDMNFKVSSYRNMSEEEIIKDFEQVHSNDIGLAVRWLLYAGDVREGMGERRLFKILYKYLASIDQASAQVIIPLVPEYTRWDNLFVLMDTPLELKMIDYISKQLLEDEKNLAEGKDVSLLAKWMPSINTSSKESVDLAYKFADAMYLTPRNYRKLLSKLRNKIDIVEAKMSSNRFDEINYSAVPSKANLIYKDAFMRHDEERRTEYLEALRKGEVKINSSVNLPHEIVYKYMSQRLQEEDITLEELWKALPNKLNENDNVLVVADSSGSMTWDAINGTKCRPYTVAEALAIYFAQRAKGPYKDKFITFSARPSYINISEAKSLREALQIYEKHSGDCSNTNIEQVFNLILVTAINNKLTQEQLPNNVLILSDMEFDESQRPGNETNTLFENIKARYERCGYKMPKLSFWNITSRTNAIPVRENDLGVSLVSGFNPAVLEMVMSNELDPYIALLKILMKERYNWLEKGTL